MKKLLTLVLALALVLSLSVANAEVVFQLAETHFEGYPTTMADYEFARLVEERTEGRVKIEVYSGSVLADSEATAIEMLQAGTLGFTRVSASPVASYVPALNAIQLPYLYKSADHMWAVLDGEIGQNMLDEVQASGSGLIGLCWYDSGSRNFYTTTKVETPADLKGLKIRMQNNSMMVDMTNVLGGVGVTGIGPNDIYSAITQGTIDGAENNWPTYYTKGDYEAATFFCLDGHTRVPEVLLGSAEILNGLDAADLEIIKACAKETQEYEKMLWAKMEAEAEAAVRANGNTIIEPTAEQVALFQAAMTTPSDVLGGVSLYEKYGKGLEEYIDAIKAVGENF